MALLRLDGVSGMPYEFCWFPYLIAENLNVIAGDGGTGKSFLALAVAAAVTRGQQPGGMPGRLKESGNVLLCSTEDDAPQIRWRFDRLNGDPEKLFLPPAGELPNFDDAGRLQGFIHECGARLVICDPVQSFLAGGDLNKASDLRPMLDALREICRKEHCTILLLAHSNKATQQPKAAYRVSGSTDLVNGCRSALMVGFHPSEAGIRVCAHAKSNGPYGASFRFLVDGGGAFRWAGEDSLTAEQIMNTTRSKPVSLNPVVQAVLKGVEENGGRYRVTVRELSAITQIFDLRVSDAVLEELRQYGISAAKKIEGEARKTVWTFTRQPDQPAQSKQLVFPRG